LRLIASAAAGFSTISTARNEICRALAKPERSHYVPDTLSASTAWNAAAPPPTPA
jgi:hypothetical protein